MWAEVLEDVHELINRISGSIKVIDRFFSVPVDYAKPDGPHIRIFARNLVPLGESREPSTDAAESDLPYRMSFSILSSVVCMMFTRENQCCICKVTHHDSNNCDQRLTSLSCRWSRFRYRPISQRRLGECGTLICLRPRRVCETKCTTMSKLHKKKYQASNITSPYSSMIAI
jgi:hypothetical protein